MIKKKNNTKESLQHKQIIDFYLNKKTKRCSENVGKCMNFFKFYRLLIMRIILYIISLSLSLNFRFRLFIIVISCSTHKKFNNRYHVQSCRLILCFMFIHLESVTLFFTWFILRIRGIVFMSYIMGVFYSLYSLL